MNSRSANSGGSASPVPPPPPIEVFVLLPDGSCIPATPDKLKIVLRQARSAATKQARLKAQEKAVELQCSLEDRAAARRLLQELAEIDLERRRMAATLRARVKADRPARQTSDVVKRVPTLPSRRTIAMTQVPSSWIVDDLGMRGVHYDQRYIGRKSPGFYRGAARDRWEYEVRDEAVLRDASGEPVVIDNLGADVDEIGAAWQAIEDATQRKNGKIQIRIIVALDADASEAENIAALKHFCETVLEPLGLPYSAVIHRAPDAGDQRNVHAHILTNFRPTERVGPYCWSFADHVRGELDGKNGVQMLRHLWAHSMSEAAEQAQRDMRYTGLGYGARGLDLETGEHLDEARSAMSRRGDLVWAQERNRIKQARNAARLAIRDADKKIAALTALRDSLIAQADADRAGTAPARRIVSKLRDRRPSRETVRAPSSSMHLRRSEMRAVAGQGDRASALHVASRDRATPVELVKSTTEQVRVTPLVGSRAIQPAGQLTGSTTPARPTRLISTQASYAEPPMSPGIVPQLVSSPLDATGAVRHERVAARVARDPGPLEQLLPTTAVPARDSTQRKARDLLAALARWREDQSQGTAINQPHKSAEPVPASEPASKHPEHSALVPANVPPFVSAYRKRRATTKPARRFEPTDTLPTREWLEHNLRFPFDESAALQLQQDQHLIAWLRKTDAYVADFGSGWLELDPQVAVKLKIDDDRLQRPHVQRELTAIRQEQQQVLTELNKEASKRPLAFSKAANRFWPNDLEPALLRRLDHWFSRGSEGLSRDLFPIERTVREAHRRDQSAKAARTLSGQNVLTAPASAANRTEIGTRLRPVARIDALARLRIPPFTHRRTATTSLKLLLRHAAEHPDDIAITTKAPPRVSRQIPEAIENLLHQWQDNDRVMSAVAETIRLSKAAGRPDWPAEFTAAMHPPKPRLTPHGKRRDTDRSR